MAVTPRGIVAPDAPTNYDLIVDLNAMAVSIDTAIGNGLTGANAYKGTAAQRAAFLTTAAVGQIWQDTDGIGMIWKKVGAAWVPAVWRWTGTTAQMNAFTQAPNGFEWFNTTNNTEYVRLSGAWTGGWTNILTPPPGAPQGMWRIDPLSGKVEMKGIVSKGTGYGFFTLPVGARPSQTVLFHDATAPPASDTVIQINAAGSVSHSLNTAVTLSLDNVSFAPVPA